MKRLFLATLISFLTNCLFGQTDHVGSGRALQFDGVDDYIDLGNVYDDLTLPFSVSAWVYIDPTSTIAGPVLVTQDNNPVYNGFWFVIHPTSIGIEYGDGMGDNHPSYRRGKSGSVTNLKSRWLHVCAVMKGYSDVDLYVNGVNIGGAYGGNSALPMASQFPADVAKIGYFLSNGITYRFKGKMDELRLYNRALTEAEIRIEMCSRLQGNEAGLIGYWNFDETSGNVLKDLSSKHFDGQLIGNPTRVFSGAPVGNESVFLYTSSWQGVSLTKDDLAVENVSGGPFGVHIYKVNSIPSQTGGLDIASLHPPYYGIFLASDDNDVTFGLSFEEDNVCKSFLRKDNSVASWVDTEDLADIEVRTEIIPTTGEGNVEVDLGPDITLCDKTSLLLETGETGENNTFLWSTGEITSSISIASSGVYSVEVREACHWDKDTIQVLFLNTPPQFYLGENETQCSFESKTLSAGFEIDGFDLTWQDRSKEKTFTIEDYGTYWLRIENACGMSSDTITFSEQKFEELILPNMISPDNDDDFNQYFTLDPLLAGSQLKVFNRWGKQVYQSVNYQNDWDGEGLPSGIYFYTLHGACIENLKGSITILR